MLNSRYKAAYNYLSDVQFCIFYNFIIFNIEFTIRNEVLTLIC